MNFCVLNAGKLKNRIAGSKPIYETAPKTASRALPARITRLSASGELSTERPQAGQKELISGIWAEQDGQFMQTFGMILHHSES